MKCLRCQHENPPQSRFCFVEDCGPVINPMIVEGQVHGAVAQGIGETLGERLVYDDFGQRLTGSLMDYALPAAADLPSFRLGHLETPSPLTPGSHKGVGEGGTIGAPPPSTTPSGMPCAHLGSRSRRCHCAGNAGPICAEVPKVGAALVFAPGLGRS